MPHPFLSFFLGKGVFYKNPTSVYGPVYMEVGTPDRSGSMPQVTPPIM